MNPFLATDGYKTGHHKMYPEGTTLVYSNFTPRHGGHSNIPNSKGVISFGQQMVMRQIKEMFDKNFFQQHKFFVCNEIQKEYSMYLGYDYDISHIEDLYDLGYLPIKVKALPEGSFCPYGVPVLTIVNTKPEFFWLTNFLETLLSNLLWLPMTSATTAHHYKGVLTEAALKTDRESIGFVEFQGHNFAMRGMSGLDSAMYAGLGHATSFLGDDGLPTIHGARKYYDTTGPVVHSVNATEHSVMCAGGAEVGAELETFRYLMGQFPTGILSIVSDTWNLWDVLTVFLPALKSEIMKRDGKIVIRPDSGDPVDIICGMQMLDTSNKNIGDDISYYDHDDLQITKVKPHHKGVIELLWDLFGGTTNEQGYKVLDPHIGAIYGDSITPQRAQDICDRLEAKGFASTNVVLGIGSFTYQYVTRDTHGFAMKATYVEIEGEGREIFKDPITGDGSKKSAKGLLRVERTLPSKGVKGEYFLIDQVGWEGEQKGDLRVIFTDGKFYNPVTFSQIREKLNKI